MDVEVEISKNFQVFEKPVNFQERFSSRYSNSFRIHRLYLFNYIFIQVGAGTEASIWFINEGREYIEAP
ncbi:MAG TPA: hypothetical protein EYP30_03680, partial [Archaeoglobaceae archaeon]|nr:hypothetical protein [Archaeoglobaceae archaeon]